jgi:hypothetical protein
MKNIVATSKVRMDARKLLSAINQGHSSSVALTESKLSKIGENSGRDFKLISLHNNYILFEDVKSSKIYRAKYDDVKSFNLSEVTEIVVVDEKKEHTFDKACSALVEAVENMDEEGDNQINKIFSQFEKGLCSPRVIPESGVVKTRDGNTHKIHVSDRIIDENIYPVLRNIIKEAVDNKSMVISEGVVKSGDTEFKLPINELTKRQVIARHMCTVAEAAYKSNGFKSLIKSAAGHLSNKNVRGAIDLSKKFFKESQEFAVLGKRQFNSLIENAMYANGIFNHKLQQDTAKVLWETNCLINRKDIINEWKTAARSTGIKEFIENTKILEDTSNNPTMFSETYDKFLGAILNEDRSTKAIKAQAYLNMLKLLKNVVAGSDADQAVEQTIDDLMVRLESDLNAVDDATLYEVEDLLATVGTDLVSDVDTLSDFDTIPEPAGEDTFGMDADLEGEFEGDMGEGDFGGMGGMGGEDMGGDFGGEMGGEDLGGEDMGGDFGGEMGGEDLGGEGEEFGEEGEEEEEELPFESLAKSGKTITELSESDLKIVLEALKEMKPEVVEIDGEFQSLRKKSLTEDQDIFVKSLIEDISGNEILSQVSEAYYDAIIDAPLMEDVGYDPYQTDVEDVRINEQYDGIEDEGGAPPPWRETDSDDEEETVEEGKKPWETDDDDSDDDEETVEEGKKPWETDEDSDDSDDSDDDVVEEGMAILVDDDEDKLMDIISQVMGNSESDDGDIDGVAMVDGDVDDIDDIASGESDEADHVDAGKNAGPDGIPGTEDDGKEVIADEEECPEGDESCDMNEDNDITDPNNNKYQGDGDTVGDPVVKEDNDITDPDSGSYSSEADAEKDGQGNKINNPPKFSDTDYDGTGNNKTGKDSPNSGLPGATKG